MANSYNKQLVLMTPGDFISESGINVKKLRNGDLNFSVSVIVDGVRIHQTVGRSSEGVKRADAERLIERLRTEAREGRLKLPKNSKLSLSFREVAGLYVTHLKETNGSNIARKEQHLRAHLLPWFGRLQVDSISKSKVAAFASHLKGSKKLGETTSNRYLSTLGHVFSIASYNDKKWVPKESVPEIDHFAESRGRTQILSTDDQLRLLQAAWEDTDPQLYLFVVMGLQSTGRHGEMVAHRWGNFFSDRRRIHIPNAKAGPRDQPLTVELTAALIAERAKQRKRGLGSDDDYVFLSGPGSTKPHRASFGSAFKRAVIRAGLDPKLITPHVMRHTSITALITSRVPLPLAQTISGHKTLAMLMHYYHAANPDIDEAVDILSARKPLITQDLHTPLVSAAPGAS